MKRKRQIFLFTGLPSQRPETQLHDAQVVPGADQPLPEDPVQQASGARLEDVST